MSAATAWTAAHLRTLRPDAGTTAALIDGGAVARVVADDVWDSWPVLDTDGSVAAVDGVELWMALSAPASGHPEHRHDVARLRLLGLDGAAWRDLGAVFPDGASPGSREWSGSAIRRDDGTVSVFYTAAGVRGEAQTTYVQRVMEARCRLDVDGGIALVADGAHREIVRAHSPYLPADEVTGAPGHIRAFRDPGWFCDPADGREYLLIAASVPARAGFMGAVALAALEDGAWSLRPPLLCADGINHELERPHVVVHDGGYYLFLCTHAQSFHPAGAAPTGLYGFVASRLTGPYEPLNGSGLVIANPPAQPEQVYAWVVLPDLRAVGFVDYLSPDGGALRTAPAAQARAAFAGTTAPALRVELSGARSRIAAVQPLTAACRSTR
jgi:levansucrase